MIENAHGRAIRWMACSLILALATWGWCEADAGKSQASQAPDKDGATAEPSAIDLRPNFVAGRNATYEMWQRIDLQQSYTVGSRQEGVSLTLEMRGEIYWEVIAVRPDGSARCGLTIRWLMLRVTPADEQPVEIDTRRAAPADGMAKEMHDAMSVFHNQHVQVDVSPAGTVTALHGMEALERRAEAAGVEQRENLLDYAFLAETLACLPAAPAAARPDVTWRHGLSESSPFGQREEDTTYRLVGVESIAGIPVATVETEAKVSMAFDEQRTGAADMRTSGTRARMQIMYDLQRHEVVGSHRVNAMTLTTARRHGEGPRFSSQTQIEAQTQFLRIAEEDPS